MCAWKESQITKIAFIRSKVLDVPVSRTMESPKSGKQSDEALGLDWWRWAGGRVHRRDERDQSQGLESS